MAYYKKYSKVSNELPRGSKRELNQEVGDVYRNWAQYIQKDLLMEVIIVNKDVVESHKKHQIYIIQCNSFNSTQLLVKQANNLVYVMHF